MLNETNLCVQELMDKNHSDRILIMYPYEFRNEQILKDNIPKMTKVLREYINETKLYMRCIDAIPNLIWDSQKASLQNEADEHQRKADKLAEIMDDGISPYRWYVTDGKFYNATYVVYLKKI